MTGSLTSLARENAEVSPVLLLVGIAVYELSRRERLGKEGEGGIALSVGLHLYLPEERLAFAEVGGIF